MRNKRWLAAALVMLMLCAVQPSRSAAAGGPSTDVICSVEPYYLFSLPTGGTLRFPQSRMPIGVFRVNSLLIQSGEWLSVRLTAGPLRHRERPHVTLPYVVEFRPPARIGMSEIGKGYGVTVRIGADAFGRAPAGAYDAQLVFRVESHPEGSAFWEGTVNISAAKLVGPPVVTIPPQTPPGGPVRTPKHTVNPPGGGHGPTATSRPARTPSPTITPKRGQTAQPVIEPETPLAPRAAGSWLWAIVIPGGLLLLWLVFLLIRKLKQGAGSAP